MRVFIGIFFATLTNFLMGLFGFYLSSYSFFISFAPQNFHNNLSVNDYFFSFILKFFVILILTWIMYRVMTMLDSPKKRVLFIFLLGSAFSLYYQVDIFWSESSLVWGFFITLGESINWLLTGYVLSKFIRPKHLGAY
tara:strand:+ start:139 stop:552 length:414 start_codon:yes stop_codon:yes gene_type:complete